MAHSAFLHQICDHDDYANILLPHHPPEVHSARLQGALSCYVGPWFINTLGGQKRAREMKAISVIYDIWC